MTVGKKIAEFTKPYTQEEVMYTTTSPDLATRCEVCRFFCQGSITHDPCLLVPNYSPYPIVTGGSCVKFDALPATPMLPSIEYEEPEESEGSEGGMFELEIEITPEMYVGEMAHTAKAEKVSLALESREGFKMFGPDDSFWLAWYSNNFEDKDGEIFATESLDHYNKMVAAGVWELPELWSYHQPYLKHGKALHVFRAGHFQLAVGRFDDPADNELVEPFKKYYREHPVTMSHGFYYSPKYFRDGVYYRHQTFEISTLKPGREANPFFTSLREVVQDDED